MSKPVAPYDIADFLAPRPTTDQFIQQMRAQATPTAPRPANEPYDMNAIFKPSAPAYPITGYFDANNRYTHLDPTSKVLGFDANGIPILQSSAKPDRPDTLSPAIGTTAPSPVAPASQPTAGLGVTQATQAPFPIPSPQDQYLKATSGGLMMTLGQIATAASTGRFLNGLQNPTAPGDLVERLRPDASDLLPDGSHRGGDIGQGVDPFRDREINTAIGSALWNATAVPRAMYQAHRNRPDLAVAELGKRNPFDPALQSTTPWIPDTNVAPDSSAAAFGRAYARSAAPTVGGLAGAETFAPIGAAYGASLTPLTPEVGGAVVGGGLALVGALGGGYLVDKAQEDLLRYSLGEKTYEELERKYATDAQEQPMATQVGDLAPGLFWTKPSLSFSPAANMNRAIGASVGLTQEGLQQLAQGKTNPGRLALAAAGGAVLSGDHTAAGEQAANTFRNVGEGAAAGLGPSIASRMRDGQMSAWMRDQMSGAPVEIRPVPPLLERNVGESYIDEKGRKIYRATGNYAIVDDSTSDTFFKQSANGNFSSYAIVSPDGHLQMLTYVKRLEDGRDTYLEGFHAFKLKGEILKKFEGQFKDIELRFAEDNKQAYLEMRSRGIPMNVAALSTPSGAQLAKLGFTVVRHDEYAGNLDFYFSREEKNQ